MDETVESGGQGPKWHGEVISLAQKRMFSLQVVDTDKFLDLPLSAQALYFHLGMHGDDDGFVSSPKRIARSAGCSEADIRLLADAGFLILFDSGVVAIADWRINNTLQNDRYKETLYREEKAMLCWGKAEKYRLISDLEPECIQNVSTVESQQNVTQQNKTKHSVAEQRETEFVAEDPPAHTRFSPPDLEMVRAYCREQGYQLEPETFLDYYTANGWMLGQHKMKDWKAAVRRWERKEHPVETEKKPRWVVGTVV